MDMEWFEQVFGFPEPRDYDQARQRFRVEDTHATGDVTLVALTSPPRRFHVGKFDTPSVGQLRDLLATATQSATANDASNANGASCDGLTFDHTVGDVADLHATHAGAVFQAASQFNCLEMTSPNRTPDDGITGYCHDHTQGPACALACPAATLYRNYLVNDGQGQGGAAGTQLDLLSDAGAILGNANQHYWKMKNGYVMPKGKSRLLELGQKIHDNPQLSAAARDALRVGVHWNTEVTSTEEIVPMQVTALADESATDLPHATTALFQGNGRTALHNVTQVYCSAVPVGYSTLHPAVWKPLASLVLEGLYEATLGAAAVLAKQRPQHRVTVFLTMVGGGVFANDNAWIVQAIQRALDLYRTYPLDVYLVHYESIDSYCQQALPVITGQADTPVVDSSCEID